MKTLVCFHAGGGAFAVPVESTTAVREAAGIVVLPGSHGDVVGILPGEPPLTVLSTLGAGKDHVLVLAVDGVSFGLLVEEVVDVRSVADADIGPRPPGQDRSYITGVLRDPHELILIADPRALADEL